MKAKAPTRPPDLQSLRVRLATGPAAVPEARSQVQAAIRRWKVPVDPEEAILLTSELVTNAIRHETGPEVVLVIARSCGELRVDVHDTSHRFPEAADVPADAETGRGLLLVAAMSAEWGYYRTPTGKAVYFTLACQARPGPRGRRTPPAGESHNGNGQVTRDLSRGAPSALQRSCDARGASTSAG